MQVCNHCGFEKDDECFALRSTEKKIRHRRCRSCQKQYDASLYKTSPDRAKKIHVKRRERVAFNREYVRQHLATYPCVDCGESDIRCLDFDHVRGKKVKDVCELSCSSWSLVRIVEEIKKCEVRCSNCHRKVTVERLKIPKVA